MSQNQTERRRFSRYNGCLTLRDGLLARKATGATSSSSSKLIHGGLRYLEHYEFRLVNEAGRT